MALTDTDQTPNDTSASTDVTVDDAGPSDTSNADIDAGPQVIGLEEAEALYGQYCSICHGENGEGYAADGANQLNNQSWLATVTDEHIRQGIAIGRPPTTMSSWSWPYGGPLTSIEVDALVLLIRGWQTEPTITLSDEPITGSAKRGAGIWSFNVLHAMEALAKEGPSRRLATRCSCRPPAMPFCDMRSQKAAQVPRCLGTRMC